MATKKAWSVREAQGVDVFVWTFWATDVSGTICGQTLVFHIQKGKVFGLDAPLKAHPLQKAATPSQRDEKRTSTLSPERRQWTTLTTLLMTSFDCFSQP